MASECDVSVLGAERGEYLAGLRAVLPATDFHDREEIQRFA